MGQSFIKEKLFHEIDCNSAEKVKYILLTHPNLINQYFDEEKSSTPLTKACWLGYTEVVNILLSLNANVNLKVKNGFSSIFYASERGHSRILKKLLSVKNCEIYQTDNRGFTALDIAVVKGYYNCALVLVKKGLYLKSIDFYELQRDHFVSFEIDFEWFLRNVRDRKVFSDREANKFIFKKKEIYTENRIIDPNESWGQFFKSVIGFSDPKIVPLKKMGKDFKPENRSLHKLKSVINWRNQNYLENFKKEEIENKSDSMPNLEFADIEKNGVRV